MIKKIKLKFSGPPYLAHVYDAETDEELTFIQRVDLVTIDVQNQVYEAKLVVHLDQIEGQIFGEVSAVDITKFDPREHMKNDAALDRIANAIERRIISRRAQEKHE